MVVIEGMEVTEVIEERDVTEIDRMVVKEEEEVIDKVDVVVTKVVEEDLQETTTEMVARVVA